MSAGVCLTRYHAREKNSMNNVLTLLKRKVDRKACRLLFFMALLLTGLLLPNPVLAQKGDRLGINLMLRGAQSNFENDATSGQDNKFFLDVTNYGNVPLTNIRLSAEPPPGWTVTIQPAEINSLAAGALQTVDVGIKPVGGAMRQTYQVTFIAQSNEIDTFKSSFPVNVKPSGPWLWIWVAVGVVVVGVFVLVYMKFGRQ